MFNSAASLLVTIYYWTSFLSVISSGSTCGPPTPPYGSIITHPLNGDKLTHDNGSVVLFGCKQGFYLVGPPIIKCTGSSWTQINFKCLGFCPELRSIPNGRVVHVPTRISGKTAVEFHCETNYRLIGRPRLECIDGRWRGRLPFCEELKSCKRLDTPANGTKHGASFNHGAQVDFSCLSGFDLFGSRKLTCRNGFWSASVPSCKAYCMKVRDPLNGRKHGIRFGHGRLVSFECKPGYELVGHRTLQCIEGKWNSTVPICKAMLCPDPLISKNAYIVHPVGNNVKYIHATKIFLACREGNYLVGIPLMVCNTTFWSKMEFNCIASCPTLGSLENAVITHTSLKDGGEVEIECQTNYTLVGASRIKCIDGKWNASLPLCKASCSDPSSPVNGNRIGDNFKHGSWVSFSCATNHRLIGKKAMTCINGSWSDSLPKCIVLCPNPGEPVHGRRLGNDFLDGKTVTFKCNNNYDLTGNKNLRCNGRKWSDKIPECRGRCKFLGNPSKGYEEKAVHKIGEALPHSSHVEYACEPSYSMVGPKFLYCIDGAWNASLPSCKAPCLDPGFIQHGSREGNNLLHRHTITYKCDDHYTLVGSRKLTCNDGYWNSKLPECKERCYHPGRISNGISIGINFTHGGTIGFICFNGTVGDIVDVIGAPTITCKDGQWSAPKPSCQARCTDPGRPDNGVKDESDYRSGATVTFKCNPPLQLEGDRSITCNNGTWSGSRPRCSACGHPLEIENYEITDWRRRPSLVRLRGPSSWCTSQAGAYLQIDLDKPYKLTAIATQGAQDLDRWVSNYKIKFKAGAYFLTYREFGSEKVIQGNTDATAVSKYTFKRPFIAQNVKIYPVVERDSRHCLKTELYGCSPPPGCILIGSMFWGKWSRKFGVDHYYKVYITKLDDSKFEFELLINAKQTRTYDLNASFLIIDEIPAPTDISVDSKVIALHNPQYPDWYRTGSIERIDLSKRSPYFVRFENNQLRWVAREDLGLVRRPMVCPQPN